jgi:hypothetical protein
MTTTTRWMTTKEIGNWLYPEENMKPPNWAIGCQHKEVNCDEGEWTKLLYPMQPPAWAVRWMSIEEAKLGLPKENMAITLESSAPQKINFYFNSNLLKVPTPKLDGSVLISNHSDGPCWRNPVWYRRWCKWKNLKKKLTGVYNMFFSRKDREELKKAQSDISCLKGDLKEAQSIANKAHLLSKMGMTCYYRSQYDHSPAQLTDLGFEYLGKYNDHLELWVKP